MSLRPGKIIRVRIFAAWLFFCPRTGYVAPRIVAVRLRVISAQPARYSTACKDPKQGYIVFAARGLSRNRRSYRIDGILLRFSLLRALIRTVMCLCYSLQSQVAVLPNFGPIPRHRRIFRSPFSGCSVDI